MHSFSATLCHENGTTVEKYANFSQYGGSRLPGDVSESLCIQTCLALPSCKAVDYAPWERSCWLHTNTTSMSQTNNTCCNHYKKVSACTCKYCEHKWTPFKCLLATFLTFQHLWMQCYVQCVNSSPPRQNGCHFADDFWSAFSWKKRFVFWLQFF